MLTKIGNKLCCLETACGKTTSFRQLYSDLRQSVVTDGRYVLSRLQRLYREVTCFNQL